jgi:hypothetical protein
MFGGRPSRRKRSYESELQQQTYSRLLRDLRLEVTGDYWVSMCGMAAVERLLP